MRTHRATSAASCDTSQLHFRISGPAVLRFNLYIQNPFNAFKVGSRSSSIMIMIIARLYTAYQQRTRCASFVEPAHAAHSKEARICMNHERDAFAPHGGTAASQHTIERNTRICIIATCVQMQR